jgi:hypothetical protein
MSADQSRVLLPLRTGTRTIIEMRRTLKVERPTLASISGVTLLAFKRTDLRNPDILKRAAALIRSVGAERGVLLGQRVGDVQDRVMVRVDGLTGIEERAPANGSLVVRLEEDPQPNVRRSGVAKGVLGIAAMLW